jgi:hypothetical protein
MRPVSAGPASSRSTSNQWVLLVVLLGVSLGVLFSQSFEPRHILFSNDAPLGFLSADENHMPGRFAGCWANLAWLGNEQPSASVTITALMRTLLSVEMFLKIYAPFSLFFVGFSAWVFFRQLRFNPTVCALGAVAAALNMHFFSVACWGLGSWEIAAGMAFLALAALVSKSIQQLWAKAILAGLAVGMGLMEGFDLGALLSVCIGVFVVFWLLIDETVPVSQRIARAAISEVAVIFFAAFIAAHTLSSLIETQIQGVAAMEQDDTTKGQRWNAATQWSLPKWETLDLLIPGLFGNRMSQNITGQDHASAYWGLIGQDARISLLQSSDVKVRQDAAKLLKVSPEMVNALATDDLQSRQAAILAVTKKSGIYWRYSGSGECAGTMVFLLAMFALANLWRPGTVWSRVERLSVGFWGGVAVFCLLAAWGRYGFLYRILYQIPYFSTIRNPIKFLHIFHLAWVILATFGMETIWRRYLRATTVSTLPLGAHLKVWWAKVSGFDRKWTIFTVALIGVSALGYLLLQNYRHTLVAYIESENIPSALATQIAGYLAVRVAWFIAFLTASVLVLIGIVSGVWTGSGAKTAWIFIAALMIADLARADLPWIRYYDYGEKYSLNPVVDLLQDKPYEHRVIGKLEPRGPGSGITPGFGELYFFWLQNDFPYHNIQALDFAQMPHMPDLDRSYLKAFELQGTDIHTTDLWPAMRLWQLTNTRYILASANAVEMLNNRLDPGHHSFHILSLFDIHPKPGVGQLSDLGDLTVDVGQKGGYAVTEFGGALPRAKLYTSWNTPTNDDATLLQLSSRSFDPNQTVLVSKDTPLSQASGSPETDPGSVAITEYRSKHVQLEADVKAPAVLLLNDRISASWHVFVDGTPAPLLRCNYLMRGVFLTPGHHTVNFRFQPSLNTLYVSLAAVVVGIALAGYLVVKRAPVPVAPQTAPAPASPAKSPQQSPPVSASVGNRNGKGPNRPKSGPSRKS